MYIKKADRKLFSDIDTYFSISKGFNKFIEKIRKEHNLIIKTGKQYQCTNCKYVFTSKQKINDICKCPNCKYEYQVKSSRLQYYEFYDNLGLIDRYKEFYIIRHFELITHYNFGNITYDLCEYARKIYDEYFEEKYEIVNDHISSYMGGRKIVHDGYIFNRNWRYLGGYYDSICDDLIYYPGNIKKILSNTKWKYSQLWILAKKEKYFDIVYLFRNYTNAIEMLIKSKLYSLALNPRTFNKKGTFEDRFGVDKSYLKFMQKNNIKLRELDILKIIKIKDIKLIRYFLEIYDIEELLKYCKPYDLLKYDIANKNVHDYGDYLRLAREMKYNLKDKKILYPKNLNEEHDKLVKLYQVQKNKQISKKIDKIYNKLKKNIYQDKKYIIYPAKTIEEMIEESSQQNNCVKTYAESYSNNKCQIYFMRLINEQNKSLVTVEVRDNQVVQQRTKNNQDTTKEQKQFLTKWENKILNAK